MVGPHNDRAWQLSVSMRVKSKSPSTMIANTVRDVQTTIGTMGEACTACTGCMWPPQTVRARGHQLFPNHMQQKGTYETHTTNLSFLHLILLGSPSKLESACFLYMYASSGRCLIALA